MLGWKQSIIMRVIWFFTHSWRYHGTKSHLSLLAVQLTVTFKCADLFSFFPKIPRISQLIDLPTLKISVGWCKRTIHRWCVHSGMWKTVVLGWKFKPKVLSCCISIKLTWFSRLSTHTNEVPSLVKFFIALISLYRRMLFRIFRIMELTLFEI